VPLIEVDDVSKSFDKHPVLHDVSFTVDKNTIFGFLGPNGAGKSTTIRCMMGQIFPNKGSIHIANIPVDRSHAESRAHVGYVSSDVQLNDNWTGHDHVSFVEYVRKAPMPRELVERFSLDLSKKAKQLSSGNKQKLSFVLALIGQPEILILDEPTRGLDPIVQETMYDVLEDFRNDGGCIFLSSHNLNEVERLCDHVAVLREGHIVANETMDSLRNLHIHNVTVDFGDNSEADLSSFGTAEHVRAHSVRLQIEGDINPFLQFIAQHQVADLAIEHAPLEDTFLHFYEDKS
jgi:ABC-2 type transport system ATP-binding protein